MLAWLWSMIILLTILASTCIFVLESFQEYSKLEVLEFYELVAVLIFTVEYSLRFLFHMGSSRTTFVFSVFNMIDLMAILPWYLERVVASTHFDALRVLRILRLFRLLRHSPDLKMLVTCISLSIDSFKLLALFLGFAILIFSSAMWYAERGIFDDESVRLAPDPARIPLSLKTRSASVICCAARRPLPHVLPKPVQKHFKSPLNPAWTNSLSNYRWPVSVVDSNR